MAYEKMWGQVHPGCLIVLLDQSGSMDDAFGGSQIGAGRKKADMVANVLNRTLDEFIRASTVGAEVRARADVAVLGYGGGGVKSALPAPLDKQDFVSLPELQLNPRKIETRTAKQMDDVGNVYEEMVYFTIWVNPTHSGGTPMIDALTRARVLAEQWVAAHPENYPPVVVNVTDGVATDVRNAHEPVEIVDAAAAIQRVGTTDGGALLFNCHITDSSNAAVEFPSSEAETPGDVYARILFQASSEIPDSARQAFFNLTGKQLVPGTRGYIFNGDANSVRNMLVFGSTAATVPGVDRNR